MERRRPPILKKLSHEPADAVLHKDYAVGSNEVEPGLATAELDAADFQLCFEYNPGAQAVLTSTLGENVMERYLKLLVLGLLIPAVVEAAKVNVKFIDQDNKPLTNVNSKIVNSDTKAEQVRKINKKGKLGFENVTAGKYGILSQKEGYIQATNDSVDVGDKDLELTVRLVSLDLLKKLETEGNDRFRERNFLAAIEKYQAIIGLVQNSPMALSNTARAYGMLRQRDKAIEAARKAAALDQAGFGQVEKQVMSVMSFEEGKEFLEKKEFSKAADSFNASVQTDPSVAEAFVGLALAYANQQKYVEALKSIQEALRLKPGEQGFLEIEKALKHNAGLNSKPK